ncbi:MAG: hypothetical protein ABL932_12225 [Terricaulis sp.]
MKFTAHIAFACLIAVAACTPPAATTTEAPATTVEAAAPTEAAPTREFIVGRWGENGDCAKDLTINADGTFSSYSGMSGHWTLEGDGLNLDGESGSFALRVATGPNDTLMIGQPDGGFGSSTRC